MNRIQGYANVFLDSNSAYSFDELNEREFFLSFLSALRQKLCEKFNEFEFYLFSTHNPLQNPDSKFLPGDRKVLIYISEETGFVPIELTRYYLAVFKSYLPTDKFADIDNLFAFPLGYSNNIKFPPLLPIEQRPINVFFCGSLKGNRLKLYKQFTFLNLLPDFLLKAGFKFDKVKRVALHTIGANFSDKYSSSYINFTLGFMQGVDRLDYNKMLSESKIVLCPSGQKSSETSRHFEGMKAGCIIISEPLPDVWFYRNSPILIIKSWKEGLHITQGLISSLERLKTIQEQTLRWWENTCSEEALAEYVKKVLLRLSIKNL